MSDFVRLILSKNKETVVRISTIQYWIEDYPNIKIFFADRGTVTCKIYNEDFFQNAIAHLEAMARI